MSNFVGVVLSLFFIGIIIYQVISFKRWYCKRMTKYREDVQKLYVDHDKAREKEALDHEQQMMEIYRNYVKEIRRL